MNKNNLSDIFRDLNSESSVILPKSIKIKNIKNLNTISDTTSSFMPQEGGYSDATSSFIPQKGGYLNNNKDITQLLSMLSATSDNNYTTNSTDTEQLKNKLFNILQTGSGITLEDISHNIKNFFTEFIQDNNETLQKNDLLFDDFIVEYEKNFGTSWEELSEQIDSYINTNDNTLNEDGIIQDNYDRMKVFLKWVNSIYDNYLIHKRVIEASNEVDPYGYKSFFTNFINSDLFKYPIIFSFYNRLIKKINDLNVTRDLDIIQWIYIISKRLEYFINRYRDIIINMKDFGDIRQIRNTLIKNLNNDIFFLKEKSDMLLEIDMETRIMIKSLGIREEEKWDKDINKYFMSDPFISL
jgi:hypothetical protein